MVAAPRTGAEHNHFLCKLRTLSLSLITSFGHVSAPELTKTSIRYQIVFKTDYDGGCFEI
jgi:hypothetical protein